MLRDQSRSNFADRSFDGGDPAADTAGRGIQVKIIFALLALGASAHSALAAPPDCGAIESTSGRLACYDAANPPRAEKPKPVERDLSPAAYKDPFLAEDAKVTAKLRNICRGC